MAVPKLRFKGLTGEWDRKQIKVLFDKITKKNTLNEVDNVISNSAQYGLVSQREFFLKDIANTDNTANYYVIEHDDFVYNPRKSKEAPYGPFNRYLCSDIGIVSPLYTCLRKKSDDSLDYLMFYFQSSMWHRYMYSNGNTGVRHDRVSINDDILMKLPVSLPKYEEQKKIADFLTAFDKRIAAQQNIIADLEETKKGLLQKIFSQEIRFKDANGQCYPDWEEKRIENVAETKGGGTPSTEEVKYWGGDIQWFTPNEINSKYLKPSKRTITEDGLKQSSAKILPKHSVLMTTRASIGLLSINTMDAKVTTNQGFQSLICKKGYNSEFIYYVLNTGRLQKELHRKASGSTFLEISPKNIKSIIIPVPCMEEQKKIADFLSTFDKKITAEKQILSDLQEMKKGLLQQMFV